MLLVITFESLVVCMPLPIVQDTFVVCVLCTLCTLCDVTGALYISSRSILYVLGALALYDMCVLYSGMILYSIGTFCMVSMRLICICYFLCWLLSFILVKMSLVSRYMDLFSQITGDMYHEVIVLLRRVMKLLIHCSLEPADVVPRFVFDLVPPRGGTAMTW